MNRAPLRRPGLLDPSNLRPSKLRARLSRSPKDGAPLASPTGGDTPAPAQHLQKHWPWWVSLLLTLLANYLLISVFFPGQPPRADVSYTFFKQQVVAENVAEISSRGDTIQGAFRQTVAYPPEPGATAKTVQDFSTVQPAFANPGLETLLNTHGVVINARPVDEARNPLLTLLLRGERLRRHSERRGGGPRPGSGNQRRLGHAGTGGRCRPGR